MDEEESGDEGSEDAGAHADAHEVAVKSQGGAEEVAGEEAAAVWVRSWSDDHQAHFYTNTDGGQVQW